MINNLHAEGAELSHTLMAPMSLHSAGSKACNRGSLASGTFFWAEVEHHYLDAGSWPSFGAFLAESLGQDGSIGRLGL